MLCAALLVARSEHQLQSVRIKFDDRGTAGSWHTEHESGAVGSWSRSAEVTLCRVVPLGPQFVWNLDMDLRRIDWRSGERWVRIHPHQLRMRAVLRFGKKCKGGLYSLLLALFWSTTTVLCWISCAF